MRAWHHHGSDTPTSPRAILHHTDPKAPMGGVYQLFSTKMNLVEKSHSTFSSDGIVHRSA